MINKPFAEALEETESVRIREAMAAGEMEWSSTSSEEALREIEGEEDEEDESWQEGNVVVFLAAAIAKD